MMVYKTEGIIIKKTDLAEADRLLTIYTKDFGKLLVKAKAVKKSQAKLKGHLELFVHSYLMLAQGKNLDIITNAETIESFPYLHKNLPALAAAYYFSELVDKLMAGPEKDERIWHLILGSFRKLEELCGKPSFPPPLFDQKEGVGNSVSYFETNLLKFLGYDLTGQSTKQDTVSFIQSLLGEKINSRDFLQKAAFVLK